MERAVIRSLNAQEYKVQQYPKDTALYVMMFEGPIYVVFPVKPNIKSFTVQRIVADETVPFDRVGVVSGSYEIKF